MAKQKLSDYYLNWVKLYKQNAVRNVTLQKYEFVYRKICELAPDLKINEVTRQTYQELLNAYAKTHEKSTVADFHHHLKACLQDAFDEGTIKTDPTRRAIIKGRDSKPKKKKFLNLYELHAFIADLELNDVLTVDWLIYLIAKTGLRFAEALALVPSDFDFGNQTLTISKTWNYRDRQGGFQPTKNKSSNRKILLDFKTVQRFKPLLEHCAEDTPIFLANGHRIYNSTVNNTMKKHCENADVPTITVHGLRHTHASLLLFEGVSVSSVARRLGHSSTLTTQRTYIHIIQELENKDNDKILAHLSRF